MRKKKNGRRIGFSRRRLILKAARVWEQGWIGPAYRQLDPEETITAQKIGNAFHKLAATEVAHACPL